MKGVRTMKKQIYLKIMQDIQNEEEKRKYEFQEDQFIFKIELIKQCNVITVDILIPTEKNWLDEIVIPFNMIETFENFKDVIYTHIQLNYQGQGGNARP